MFKLLTNISLTHLLPVLVFDDFREYGEVTMGTNEQLLLGGFPLVSCGTNYSRMDK